MNIESIPDLSPALQPELATALLSSGRLTPPLQLIQRTANRRSGVNASEILVIRDGAGRLQKVLLKSRAGVREGVDAIANLKYEAAVYREVLQQSGIRTARYLGGHFAAADPESFTLFEYLDGAHHVNQDSESRPAGMRLAARWIGEFHRHMEPRAASFPQLNRLDESHYLAVARKAALYSQAAYPTSPWIPVVCRRFEDQFPELLADAVTVIHGDYYADNVLLFEGAACPVDWEWCALGPGVVDIASLTDRWPNAIMDACLAEYVAARWPAGAPVVFPRLVTLARLYLCLRYMSFSPAKTMTESRRWRFTAIRDLSETLGQ